MAGPFPIIEQVGNTYKLDLPPNMHIHDIFSLDKLQHTGMDPLPGQVAEPPEAITVNDDQEWEVEEILNSHLHHCKLQYLVKWTSYDEDQTWYPASNFKGSPHQLCNFHLAYPSKPGPLC